MGEKKKGDIWSMDVKRMAARHSIDMAAAEARKRYASEEQELFSILIYGQSFSSRRRAEREEDENGKED